MKGKFYPRIKRITMLTCHKCGHEFEQLVNKGDDATDEERRTLVAANSNKEGPFCHLCRHLEMAMRYAELRHLEDCSINIRMAQRWVRS